MLQGGYGSGCGRLLARNRWTLLQQNEMCWPLQSVEKPTTLSFYRVEIQVMIKAANPSWRAACYEHS